MDKQEKRGLTPQDGVTMASWALQGRFEARELLRLLTEKGVITPEEAQEVIRTAEEQKRQQVEVLMDAKEEHP